MEIYGIYESRVAQKDGSCTFCFKVCKVQTRLT